MVNYLSKKTSSVLWTEWWPGIWNLNENPPSGFPAGSLPRGALGPSLQERRLVPLSWWAASLKPGQGWLMWSHGVYKPPLHQSISCKVAVSLAVWEDRSKRKVGEAWILQAGKTFVPGRGLRWETSAAAVASNVGAQSICRMAWWG